MDDLDRPNLGLDVVEQIEVDLHQQDMRFWPLLKQLQLPTPETQKAYAPFVFNEGPMPPKRPQKLSELLGLYAVASFQCEASKYPRLDPRFTHWLQRLAKRIEERTIERIAQLEAGNATNSLAYHGLSAESMRVTINAALQDAMKAWPQYAELTSEPQPIKRTGDQSEPLSMTSTSQRQPFQRMPGTIHSPSAARKIEEHVRTKGLTLTSFAASAGTTERTLLRFRRSGNIRRSVLAGIARAMSLTVDELISQ